jgi:hypothetical protein
LGTELKFKVAAILHKTSVSHSRQKEVLLCCAVAGPSLLVCCCFIATVNSTTLEHSTAGQQARPPTTTTPALTVERYPIRQLVISRNLTHLNFTLIGYQPYHQLVISTINTIIRSIGYQPY